MITLFVDVTNYYHRINRKWPGRKLDYKKFHEHIEKVVGKIDRAIAYGSQREDEATGFITCLKQAGFDTRFRKATKIERKNESDSKEGSKIEYRKIDCGLALAMDVVRAITRTHNGMTAVIGSSDTDLIPMISWIKDQGVRCIVVGCGIARDLRDIADRFIELNDSFLEELKDQDNKEK